LLRELVHVKSRQAHQSLAVEIEAGVLRRWGLQTVYVVVISDDTVAHVERPLSCPRIDPRPSPSKPERVSPAIGGRWRGSITFARARCSSAPRCAVGVAVPARRIRQHATDRTSSVGTCPPGKLMHRQVSAQYAAALRQAINNYRTVRKLLCDREVETERLIDAVQNRQA